MAVTCSASLSSPLLLFSSLHECRRWFRLHDVHAEPARPRSRRAESARRPAVSCVDGGGCHHTLRTIAHRPLRAPRGRCGRRRSGWSSQGVCAREARGRLCQRTWRRRRWWLQWRWQPPGRRRQRALWRQRWCAAQTGRDRRSGRRQYGRGQRPPLRIWELWHVRRAAEVALRRCCHLSAVSNHCSGSARLLPRIPRLTLLAPAPALRASLLFASIRPSS